MLVLCKAQGTACALTLLSTGAVCCTRTGHSKQLNAGKAVTSRGPAQMLLSKLLGQLA